MITLNQYILLDPILLFFISGATFAMAKFRNLNQEEFSSKWWTWLLITGVFLGCAFSVKFGTTVVYLHTLYIFFTAGLLRKYNFVLSFPLLQWVYLLFCLLEYTQLVNCGSFWEIFHRLLNTPLNIFWPELYV